ncbi:MULTISPECIES: hypothetical protein [unclassified Streptomyces]|uniref:hypothetical protein n=1 Tax=unclassified Streptomyces TaxID=2593676 RepID=UPI002DD9A48C|nr:hypothetical protein [Streptomyces sp. NBC_01795]WSA97764.1 hypothetical protein OIE63_40470 [Streptomyces sp. NBC_01795]WSS46719.1 hypothetical protein OG220_39750 [Streptomyces sp. NBC_01187]WSS47064.1 hypothetical protein OG220_41875 [Streptomyces sp. NBC_01187]
MPTTYPVTLLPVPDDPGATWNAERIGETHFDHPDEGWPSATTVYAIDADSATEAELRVLTWIDHSYEDDLRRATATALLEAGTGRWHVSLRILGEF